MDAEKPDADWSPPQDQGVFLDYKFDAQPHGSLPKTKPMDAARAIELVDAAIKHAKFDRERFRVRAQESADGTGVEVYADTRFRLANGQLATNYQPISIEDVTDDVACAEELRMLVQSMIDCLWDFTNSETEPDGREARQSG